MLKRILQKKIKPETAGGAQSLEKEKPDAAPAKINEKCMGRKQHSTKLTI